VPILGTVEGVPKENAKELFAFSGWFKTCMLFSFEQLGRVYFNTESVKNLSQSYLCGDNDEWKKRSGS